MKIFIASDHAGFAMKQYILEYSGFKIIDLGTNGTEACDYPIFAQELSNKVLKAEGSYGILICSTGIGMAIAANRYKGIRAALCFNEQMAELSRRHNDANVIVFGSSVISNETALDCLKLFLDTGFEFGRHLRRLNLLETANLVQ
ncbi:MAG: ribose 5-phosphate isomerase B [Holosporaceae bacterium]|jgi:ribose 5-phosphate isomerase B|nr:ribose 5-phosphate isomerase B [Holosporaceae bacterium]